MTRNGFNFDDRLRCLLLAAVWFSYTALSIFLIIALLTDWPEILHRHASPLSPW